MHISELLQLFIYPQEINTKCIRSKSKEDELVTVTHQELGGLT